jgi:Caprin-1 dimerization domain
MQRKQSKKEKTERQQSELLRLQEVLHLQTLLDLLGDDVVRERLKSVPGELVSFVFSHNLCIGKLVFNRVMNL